MEPLILFDSRKCIRCHSCEVACQLENDAPPDLQLRWVKGHVSGKFPSANERFISTACFHCGDPSCVSACPSGALRKRTNGVVEHIRERCIGCGYCIQTCPFHVPRFSPAQHTMRKCSFCLQRILRGKEPACVAKCTAAALTYYKDRRRAGDIAAYGMNEDLHMVYQFEGRPGDFSLPQPVPPNMVTSSQAWDWLMGLVPGGIVLAWLWKKAADQEKDHD